MLGANEGVSDAGSRWLRRAQPQVRPHQLPLGRALPTVLGANAAPWAGIICQASLARGGLPAAYGEGEEGEGGEGAAERGRKSGARRGARGERRERRRSPGAAGSSRGAGRREGARGLGCVRTARAGEQLGGEPLWHADSPKMEGLLSPMRTKVRGAPGCPGARAARGELLSGSLTRLGLASGLRERRRREGRGRHLSAWTMGTGRGLRPPPLYFCRIPRGSPAGLRAGSRRGARAGRATRSQRSRGGSGRRGVLGGN